MTSKVYDYTDNELKELMATVQKDGWAIFYEQWMNEGQFTDIFKRTGSCEAPGQFMNDPDYPEIFRVSGERDEKGARIGMFGDGELGWHSNGNGRSFVDKILIGLYCVVGDPNTTLSICNTSTPYYDMSDDERAYYESIIVKIKFKDKTMRTFDEDDPYLELAKKTPGSIRPLIGTHPHNDLKYFYFPFHFICEAWEGDKKIDHEELIEGLKPKIFKSKYQVHHIFQPGDFILMDQFTSLHRRTPIGGPGRLLWRVASDYMNLFD